MPDDQPISRPRAAWCNSTVLGIGLASLFSDMGHEMATVAMPALLATLAAGPAVLGLIEGLADGASSFAKLYSGLYSDRLRRRKPLVVIGYLVTALGMGSFAFATQWWHVLLGRVGGWVGRGARSPVRKVLLAEATTPETYGRAFGLERAMDSAGAVAGPLAAWGLLAVVTRKALFLWTLLPGSVAALLIWLLVRERPQEPRPAVSLRGGIAGLPREFRAYTLGIGVAGLGDFSNTLLILWATQAWYASGHGRYSFDEAARLAMLFYVGYNVVYTISCYFSGLLADRFPRHWVLAAGYSLAAVPAVALLTPGDSLAKFAVVFGFSGLYMGVWETVESATAASVLPREMRGIGFGFLDTVSGAGDIVSSAAVGLLWTVAPPAAMGWVIMTSLGGAAIVAHAGSRAARRGSPAGS